MVLQAIAENPIPAGSESGLMETPEGFHLRFAHWRPESGQVKGTICLFNGRGECIEKYYEVIEELLRRRFAVATLDWRGQGGSTRLLKNPRRGHVRSFSEYDRDLNQFMRDIVLPDCPPPFYALAHSMGGTIVLRSLKGQAWFDRIVCLAPMVALRTRVVPWSVIGAASRMLKFVGAGSLMVPGGSSAPVGCGPFESNRLTRDQERYDRNCKILEEHPGLAIGSPTVSWLVAALDAVNDLQTADFQTDVKTPVLIVQAGYDQIVSNKEVSDLANNLPAGADIFLEEAFHEILMERRRIREQFWAAFDTFIPGTVVQHRALRTSNAFW